MNPDKFSQTLQQLTELQKRIPIDDQEAVSVIEQAIDLMSDGVEKIQMAETDLQQQNEALMATQSALEIERQRYQELFMFAPQPYVITDQHGKIHEANLAAVTLFNRQEKFLIGKPLPVLVMMDDRELFRHMLNRVIMEKQQLSWETRIQSMYHVIVPVHVSVTISRSISNDETRLRWLFHDIRNQKQIESNLKQARVELESRVLERTTELVRVNEQLQREIEERKRIQEAERTQRVLIEALRDTAVGLNTLFELPAMFGQLLVNLRRIIVYDIANIALLQHGKLELIDEQGVICGSLPITQAPLPLAQLLTEGYPITLSSLNHAPTWERVAGSEEMRAYAGVPIRWDNEISGCINLFSRETDAFSATEMDRLEAFAEQASLAVQKAHWYKQAQQIAILEERQYLARELHDAVSQNLFSSSLIAELLLQISTQDMEKLQEHLRHLHRLNRGALAEMRTLLLELRPAHLTEVDFTAQLQRLLDALYGRKEITVDLQIQDGVALPEAVQTVFYRVAQESINNVVKHSRATKITVIFTNTSKRASLIIRDNGQGFKIRNASGGMGIDIMHERAAQVDALLTLKSTPGRGAEIKLIWEHKE